MARPEPLIDTTISTGGYVYCTGGPQEALVNLRRRMVFLRQRLVLAADHGFPDLVDLRFELGLRLAEAVLVARAIAAALADDHCVLGRAFADPADV